MNNAANRRRKGESMAPDRRPPPPTPTSANHFSAVDNWQFATPVSHRDSDASFTSTVAASSAVLNISDRSYQLSAIRTINSYLASQSFPTSLKHPLPSAKDITETLKFLVKQLGFNSQKLDEDLISVMKFMKCPLKLNRSALRAPGTPHSWPNLLAVIHWLVQIIKYTEHTKNSQESFQVGEDVMYAMNCYGLYLRGQDEEVEALDAEHTRQYTEWKGKLESEVKGLEEAAKELEVKLEVLKGPSRKEVLEQEKEVLEKDITKFHVLIERLDGTLMDSRRRLEEKEKALEEKAEGRKRILEENEELKRKIEEQGINLRDADRIKRELQAVERDIEELDAAITDWEEKKWELDSKIGHKFKDLEQLAMDCNQALRRLKLGNGFQFQLDANGSTPPEILGLDFKSIKPELASFAEDIKRNSMEKLQELISLQKQLGEFDVKIAEKRNQIVALQSHVDGVEAHKIVMEKGAQGSISKYAAEARKMVADLEIEAQNLSVVEKEATEFLQVSKTQLQETIVEVDKQVNLCAAELFELINSVSKYKEHIGSRIAQERDHLQETTCAVAAMYKE